MNDVFYTGVSGMVAYQQDMNVTAHNIANVNTVGFKPMRSVFEDILYTKMWVNRYEYGGTGGNAAAQQANQAEGAENAAGEEEGEPNDFMAGHGVRADQIDLIHSQGNPQMTNFEMDFTIVGEGYFAVERNGRVEYTRNGAFDIGLEEGGKTGYLTSVDGGYVLDAKGQRIKLEYREVEQTVRNEDGTTTTTTEKSDVLFDMDKARDQLGIYTFSNPFGLQWVEGSSFIPTDNSGEPTVVQEKDPKPYKLLQHYLESSAANMADSMVNLIQTQRAFQLSSRVVQTGDALEEIINNLRQ